MQLRVLVSLPASCMILLVGILPGSMEVWCRPLMVRVCTISFSCSDVRGARLYRPSLMFSALIALSPALLVIQACGYGLGCMQVNTALIFAANVLHLQGRSSRWRSITVHSAGARYESIKSVRMQELCLRGLTELFVRFPNIRSPTSGRKAKGRLRGSRGVLACSLPESWIPCRSPKSPPEIADRGIKMRLQ
jgi:hypothetical protein